MATGGAAPPATLFSADVGQGDELSCDRPMHYLLKIRRGSRVWQLPIADPTASLLEESLLTDSMDRRAHLLATAIVRDRYLAIWVAEHVCPSGDDPPVETVSQAATRLAEDTAQKLLVGVVPNPVPVPMRDARLYAARVVRAAAAGMFSARADEHNFSRSVMESATPLLDGCPCDELGCERLLPAFPPFAPEGRHERKAGDDLPPDAVSQHAMTYYLEEIAGTACRLALLVRRLANLERSADAIRRELHEQKLAALKELAYGASHEINNPLANIAARAQTLLRDEPDPQRRRKLSAIYDQAMRAHEMIADLMLFAHPPQLVPAVCNLTAIARQAADGLALDAAAQQIQLKWVAPDDVQLVADPTQLGVAIGAVLKNAVEAVGHGGHIEVSVAADQARAYLVVSDDGPGMTERVRAHLFDPFFSGREAGRGLGFGLSKCWRIVTDHGGRVDVRTVEPSGTEFTIALPLRPAA
jgi:signal transduction histidine kinase